MISLNNSLLLKILLLEVVNGTIVGTDPVWIGEIETKEIAYECLPKSQLYFKVIFPILFKECEKYVTITNLTRTLRKLISS